MDPKITKAEVDQLAASTSREIRGEQTQVTPQEISQGSIYDIFVMFYEIMQQNKNHLVATSVIGSGLTAAATHQLNNLQDAFLAWVKTPNSTTSKNLADQWHNISDWGLDSTKNPAAKIIQAGATYADLNPEQEKAILSKAATYGQKIQDQVNNAFNQISQQFTGKVKMPWETFTTMLSQAYSGNTQPLDTLGTALNSALLDPQNPNCAAAGSATEATLSGLSGTSSQVATLASTTLVIENKALEGIVNAANTALQSSGSGEVRAISSDVGNIS